MQTQARRDEKTLQIFTGFFILVAVLGGGGIVLVLAHLAVGVPEDVASALFLGLIAVATALTVSYLVRQEHGQ